jgi:hypothetical protein
MALIGYAQVSPKIRRPSASSTNSRPRAAGSSLRKGVGRQPGPAGTRQGDRVTPRYETVSTGGFASSSLLGSGRR